jgi:3-deoxy-D-manno-octulosonic acid kinase
MRLPPTYERHTQGTAEIITTHREAEFVRAAIRSAGSLHGFAARRHDAIALAGRGTAYAIAAQNERWVVRHYQRGGAIAGWLGDLYLRGGVTRPEGELIVSAAARARGIPTPRVAAAVTYPEGAFYRADLATTYIPDATDLAVLTLGEQAWATDLRAAAWRSAGEVLRLCFDAGLIHPDLNLKNILVQRTVTGVTAYVIDLDRARLAQRVTPAQRTRMLARFDRSRIKIETRTAKTVTAEERGAFAAGLGV